MLRKKEYRDFDRTLIIAMFVIFAIGLLTINSSTATRALEFNESFTAKQAMWMAAGLILLFVIIRISYQRFVDISYAVYAVNVLLLLLVLVLGRARLGAQRWFAIGSFTFQPSEFIKLSLILVLANYTGSRRGAMDSLKSLTVPCILLGIPFVLVLLQPDLGTALLLLPIFLSILFVGGAKPRYIAGMIGIGLAGLPFFWHFLRDYQKTRLLVFLNPNVDPLGAGYTIIQSKIAVGSGGLVGKGYHAGTQNQLNFLPERHTDFIFSVIGEEWGFAGAVFLVLCYFFIIKKAFTIASLTTDMYGKTIACGIGTMLAMQVVINVGMTIGMMPVVGIPLPLVSYGGSSLITTVVAIGLLLNVGMRRSTF
jgi:rod shape determining protein RodA